MARYWVIGGEYSDTSFESIAGGGAEERYGPFASRQDALAKWQQLAWTTVDNAHARYRIEQEAASAAARRYWVVGGRYTDTKFTTPAEGAESWYGPFDGYDAAKAEWGRLAWQTVDDALARWRIEQIEGDPPVQRRRYWVVGGRYKDLARTILYDEGESWTGPFDSLEAAEARKKALHELFIDLALTRWRIEQGDPPAGVEVDDPSLWKSK